MRSVPAPSRGPSVGGGASWRSTGRETPAAARPERSPAAPRPAGEWPLPDGPPGRTAGPGRTPPGPRAGAADPRPGLPCARACVLRKPPGDEREAFGLPRRAHPTRVSAPCAGHGGGCVRALFAWWIAFSSSCRWHARFDLSQSREPIFPIVLSLTTLSPFSSPIRGGISARTAQCSRCKRSECVACVTRGLGRSASTTQTASPPHPLPIASPP